MNYIDFPRRFRYKILFNQWEKNKKPNRKRKVFHMGVVEVKNVGLKLGGSEILREMNIDFWRGHIHAIVGPNGAGKSTLAATIMGLDGYHDFTGDILFEGESIKNKSIDERARKGITLGWQEPARFEGLTVRKFIKSAARDKSEDFLRDQVSKLGLNPDIYLDRAIDSTLSGGERKKIEVASILAMKAKFVMLDEPDSGIDVSSLENIFQALNIMKENGSTVILITHSLAVLKQAEHAFLMCNGSILDKGSVEKLSRYFKNKCIPCDHKNLPDEEVEGVRQ